MRVAATVSDNKNKKPQSDRHNLLITLLYALDEAMIIAIGKIFLTLIYIVNNSDGKNNRYAN